MNQNFELMKPFLFIVINISFMLHSVNAQQEIIEHKIPLTQELQISAYNTPLVPARYDKSYIPYNRLLFESSLDREKQAIENILQLYIDGSTSGQPILMEEAFHSNLNLYYVKNNQIEVWTGNDYINGTKEGKPTGEIGKILSIDYTNNAAVAKVEISHPNLEAVYIDYFMLLKVQDKWTIIHKMFTQKAQ